MISLFLSQTSPPPTNNSNNLEVSALHEAFSRRPLPNPASEEFTTASTASNTAQLDLPGDSFVWHQAYALCLLIVYQYQ